MMALALTVRLGSFDALLMAGTRRGDSERDGLGVRQRTRAFGSWAPFEPHISRAGMDYAKPRCARITLDAVTRVLVGWRRYRGVSRRMDGARLCRPVSQQDTRASSRRGACRHQCRRIGVVS